MATMLFRVQAAVFLVLLETTLVSSVACPVGYTDGGDNACYKSYGNPVSRADAVKQCKTDGGRLVEVPNAFINTLISGEGKTMNAVLWIGVTCNGNGATNCYYDDGTQLTGNSYTNFYAGNPNSDIGGCVYMATSGNVAGMWFSADCTFVRNGFACQYTGNDPASCGVGYTQLNDNCYTSLNTMETLSQAEFECQAECGHLTSILSHTENQFVETVGANSSQPFTRIGLMYNGSNSYVWADGSAFDPTLYTNFGHVDPELGSCVAMALTNDVIPVGTWINTDCTRDVPSVCKKARNSPCVPNTAPPTVSPIKCTSTYFYDNNGTIYSPGYPSRYESNECEYVMSVPHGYIASVRFPVFLVDPASQVKLYNDFMDVTPFTTLSNIIDANRYFYSTENQMKMVFSTPGGAPTDKNYQWEAEFKPALAPQSTTRQPSANSGCNAGLIMAPGTISSPNYPSNYPNMCLCNYSLGSTSKVQLRFSNFITESSVDVVVIYDGADANSPVLDRLSGPHPITRVYNSTSNRMYVVFSSDSTDNFQGFSASFTSV